ncbi:MAG: DUF4384 domain-containing protein [Pseudomonadota bacterium]|nr:DUF4384 domain-containing protein [Pseudomonadota bacterium]
MQNLVAILFLGCLLLLVGCHPAAVETRSLGGFSDSYAEVVLKLCQSSVKKGEMVAVSAFYDGDNGDFTALGDQWRDRAEAALAGGDIKVRAVRDMGLILDSLESADSDRDFNESQIWRASGSDYLLVGRYYLYEGGDEKEPDYLELKINLLKNCDRTVVKATTWRTKLTPGWQSRAAVIRGNIYHKAIEVVGPGSASAGPELKVELDRNPPCYPAGARISLKIKSEPGVYLYILNIAADNSVTINYPNRFLPKKRLAGSKFIFPPPDMSRLHLYVYPLPGNSSGRESFKVISAFEELDFSFLKVPEGQIFAGAKAADLKEVLAVLQNSAGWSEVVLPYRVGRGCN